jgi:hypothetical protein
MANSKRGRSLVIGLIGMVTAALGACGDNGSTGNARGPFAEFTGTWEYTASAGTLSCPGVADQQGSLGTTKRFVEGVATDLVDLSPSILDPATQCFYTYDVTNKVASITPSQTCTFDDGTGTGGTVQDAPTSWTFTLLSATTAEETLTTTFAMTCTLTGSATLKKVGKD